jgi:hypothetical protein
MESHRHKRKRRRQHRSHAHRSLHRNTASSHNTVDDYNSSVASIESSGDERVDQRELQSLVQNLVSVDRRLREITNMTKNLRKSKSELEHNVKCFMKDSKIHVIELRDDVTLQLMQKTRKRGVNLSDLKQWLQSRYRMSESDVNEVVGRLRDQIRPQHVERLEFKFPKKKNQRKRHGPSE